MKNSQPKFSVSSAKNPCPICDRVKDGDCRITDNLVICHSHWDAVDVPGWKYTKPSDGGAGGGVFVRDNRTPPRQARRKQVKHPNERAGERVAKEVATANPKFFTAQRDPVADALWAEVKDNPTPEPESEVEADKPPKETFYQKVERTLYANEKWIAVNGILYRWANTHYQASPDEVEAGRIGTFADTICEVRRNEPSYVYATPDHIQKALKWVKYRRSVAIQGVNPPGINCTNGVLELRWEGTKLIAILAKHDPAKHFYLSPPVVTHDLDADPTEYERLMQCLDPEPRQIWERTIAASLDLDTVRQHRGRAVRAALLKGDGSNGKDALRTIAQMLLGTGAMSACTVTDFKDYDSGRKFPLFELRGKRLNWPSENADAGRIDQFRALRAAITGDPITFEQKNRPALPPEPLKTVFLFNVNEAPNLVAQLQATASRWTMIPFPKTFASKPLGDQLKADPRFKEDPQFIQQKILPAFLNRMLHQLQAVVLEGIDYSSTQNLFEEMQRESSHLLQFAHDKGLQYAPDGSVTVKELWDALKNWYRETGTLVVEETAKGKEKLTWTDQVRSGDRNVKGSNQVTQRFLEIFPKAKPGKQRRDGSNTYIPIITGIKFSETAQDVQDGQDGKLETGKGQELQPSCPDHQLPKICPRCTSQLPKMKPMGELPILGSLDPILPSSCPDDQLPKIAESANGQAIQPVHLGHLGHLAQSEDNIFSAIKGDANLLSGAIDDDNY